MEFEHPTPRPPTHACRPLTASSPDQGKQAASHESQEELESVGPPGLLTPLCGPLEDLARTVHQAIRHRNMDMLRQQVSCYSKAALEVRDEQGMTPLYHAVLYYWTEAALFLLRCGADVNNSERLHLSLYAHPFLRLVVKTEDTELLQEVIKRGANIRARDYKGSYCVNLHKVSCWKARDALFDCLAETVADEGPKRPDLLKDLCFVIRAGAVFRANHYKIEQFITRRGGCHQAEMFQVFAACCCCPPICDYKQALDYWKKSAESTPHEFGSQTAEKDLARGSVFADILDVKEHPLPTTVTTQADFLAMTIRALLTFEKFMPEVDLLVKATTNPVFSHLQKNRPATAIGILCRLTTVRTLYWREVDMVMDALCMELEFCTGKVAVPFPALLDAMKTIKNCLTSLQSMHPEAYQSSSSDRGVFWKQTVEAPFKAFLLAMVFFYEDEVTASPEQLQIFASHVKDCIQRFPWAQCSSYLHLLATELLSLLVLGSLHAPITATIIKIIVTCSAEAFGTIRQENSPPHLVSDEGGNTLLHTMAKHRSQEDLVQEGLLQCFLDHGAHLCTRNNRGQTVRGILVEHGVCTEGELLPSLQCLSAAAFMRDDRLRQTVGNCRPAKIRNFLLDH